MNRRTISILLFFLLVLLIPPGAQAELQSRYVTLRYSNQQLLRDFNDELVLGRKLGYYLKNKQIVTVQDEVLAKLDVIIEKAEVVLDMFPANFRITVVLLPDRRAVGAMYKTKYGKTANHIAYYSLKEKTIYISVDDTKLRVIAHEIGHSIVDHYFQVRPPYNIHELLAQFTEKHIVD
ncbi:hypothetical protein [Desulforhopalus sp. IMCC35007]|uniref:hypothetical protein n=1 Tax=Desulforhopalus sp. IMCC35007 TaxID=2569543 RepID=UPI0010AE64AB|nr:hypothetical protein [Desulforhopalus sp. IMCC35007]TKB06552.1 hypothetical protein FCL48_20705 [Desulforhopalus sp. IMCC35007]